MEIEILSGLPGSGKSTYCMKQKKDNPKCLVVSADDSFKDYDGNYTFKPNLLGKAHAASLRRFLENIDYPHQKLIVDNTNLSLIEIAPYYALAEAYHHSVKVVIFRGDEALFYSRQIHQVGEDSYYGMKIRHAAMLRDWPQRWKREEILQK